MMNIYEKLSAIQAELKAPKSRKNTFGDYNYRSCEDILEAVKPLCRKHKAVLVLSDKPLLIGDRYYIEATAKLFDIDVITMTNNTFVVATAIAREANEKKKMDTSQITGMASSYARKYALNGLFNIDDTKDADTDEYRKVIDSQSITKEQQKALISKAKEMYGENAKMKVLDIIGFYGYEKTADISPKDYREIIEMIGEGTK